MASFKRLKRSDVISVPYVANKNWVFEYCPYPTTDPNIKVYKGTNVTGSFSTINDPITEGQYERLVYSQMNQLYYQKYSGSLDTSSLISSLYYEGISSKRATSSYFNYNENPGLIKNFPTGAMDSIRVLSIDQNLYGEQILPYAFELSSSVYYITDDGIGNLIDSKNSNAHVGNIFYNQGLVIITNQDYQFMFPQPPLAQYKEVSFLDTDTSRTIDLVPSVDPRGAQLITSSLALYNYDIQYFTSNTSGIATLSNSVGIGSYLVNYTFDSEFTGSTCAGGVLTSNLGLLKVNITPNCDFAIDVCELPYPTPTPTPTPTSTATPTPTATAATPTPTPTPTVTVPPVSPTLTPTPTPTPTITPPPITPTPTPTPTPTQAVLVYCDYFPLGCTNQSYSFKKNGSIVFSGGGSADFSNQFNAIPGDTISVEHVPSPSGVGLCRTGSAVIYDAGGTLNSNTTIDGFTTAIATYTIPGGYTNNIVLKAGIGS